MSVSEASTPRSRLIVDILYYITAIFFFVYLFAYFWTSEGGPTFLAMTLVPITYILFVLLALREDDLVPSLPATVNYILAAVYVACALGVAGYMHTDYDLGTVRAGDWNSTDMAVGGLMTLLVLEYSRKRHMPLFVLNIVLIFYAVYGYVIPGMFYHWGLAGAASLRR